jgi:hypothetical protein
VRRSTIRRSLPASLLLACVLAAAPSATATGVDRDTGFDANDIPANGHIDPDIQSTMRKLVVHDGRRVVAIVIRFFERHAWWPMWIRMDARGGPGVDHLAHTRGRSCYVWTKGEYFDRVEVRGATHGRRLVCRMPARLVSPTKSIRWKVRTSVPDGSRRDTEFVIDYAPSNHGWYG